MLINYVEYEFQLLILTELLIQVFEQIFSNKTKCTTNVFRTNSEYRCHSSSMESRLYLNPV